MGSQHCHRLGAEEECENKVRPGGEVEVVLYMVRLKILHDIYLECTFNCKEFDKIYSAYRAKFPPPPSPVGDNFEEKWSKEDDAFQDNKDGHIDKH